MKRATHMLTTWPEEAPQIEAYQLKDGSTNILKVQYTGGEVSFFLSQLETQDLYAIAGSLRAASEQLMDIAHPPRDEATTHEATDYEAQVNDPTTHNVPPMKGAMLDAIAEGELVIDSSPDMRPQGAQGAPLSDMGIGDTHLDAREHDDSDPAARNLDRNSDAPSGNAEGSE